MLCVVCVILFQSMTFFFLSSFYSYIGMYKYKCIYRFACLPDDPTLMYIVYVVLSLGGFSLHLTAVIQRAKGNENIYSVIAIIC